MVEPGAFNPYLKWLAIPIEEQPPHHYRLLGIPPFEDDPEVVEAAAEQRTGFLRKHQAGPHGIEAGKLLNEVATARLCLLNPRKKAAYDAQLQVADDSSTEAQVAPGITHLIRRPVTWIGAGAACILVLFVVVMTRPAGKASDGKLGLTDTSNTGSADRAAAKLPVAKPLSKPVIAKQEAGRSDAEERKSSTDKTAAAVRPEVALIESPNKISSQKKSDSPTDTFRVPEGTLVVDEEMPEKPEPPARSADKSTPSVAESDAREKPKSAVEESPLQSDKPDESIADPKLQTAVGLLEKASETAKAKVFKTLKAKLAECKEAPKRQKPLSPALLAELEKLMAACDRKEIPSIRVQGTVSWNGHDYAYVNADFTWNTAREICLAMGGHLATLTSHEERGYVETTFLRPNDKPAWIGGSDAAEEGKWVWVTGEPWHFFAHINDDFGAAHAITWWRDLGFHDWLGDKRQAYVCEWDWNASADQIALGSDTRIFQAILDAYYQTQVNRLAHREKLYKAVHAAAGRLEKSGGTEQVRALYKKFDFEPPPPQTIRHKKSEYFLFREAKTWHEAEAHCERLGGHLVILDGVGEPEVVFGEALKNSISIWLGCSDERQEGVWRWLDGSPVKMQITKDNLGGDQHVGWVEVKNNKIKVFDMNAGVRSAYVCEWELE